MNKRMLGNGRMVSSIGLGCMGMDHAYGRPAPRFGPEKGVSYPDSLFPVEAAAHLSLGIPDLDAALPSPNPNAGALSGLRSLAPRASLAEGLVVRGSVVREARKNVEAWVSRLTILKN